MVASFSVEDLRLIARADGLRKLGFDREAFGAGLAEAFA